MVRTHKKTNMLDLIKRVVFITIGAVLMGVALEIFLVPNDIIDGGIAGISIILSKTTSLKLGLFLFLLNVPFLMLGYKQIGKTFAFSTLYGIAVMSLTTAMLHHAEAFTNEKLLAVMFGGIMLGAGVGLVIRFGGSLDGTEIVSILISKRINVPVGQLIMIFNVFIFIVAGFVFGWDSAMYSIFTYYIAFKMIDIVVEGLNESKSVTIISSEYDEISQAIIDRLGRNTTFIYAKGGYMREDTQMIYCVLTRLEVAKLKAIVQDIDPKAFIAIETVSDVLGGNFSKANIH
ncbi:YitT family protein [Paenibacillus thiaminolyticus]|uniref:YitT family protein n=1 Tax=Paenibacillus thiaminolyticus TaxID=49283 RepID=A0AAP9DSI0_PANTH|nr:YitT family protein [Paenibacillus thiaminolyticus]MCY9536502.1 YitT family protein [Paenibacillus thiaminolyticus]MCY9601597.1 YitT family protein [Paenibacillus thiaminolyticus]MCY9609021.1 YitT family protein [Paenibacillus thiaminolyticus]MCY9612222.1 YitT family protein [Paenibacillus thiaminolyticus]MCY9619657.1 YitT family protein [Paenibacillus thiaminolyticus]